MLFENIRRIKPLIRVGWRYLILHPWQGILMVVGIALGVAVVVSIDLANTSASKAFNLSTQAIAGKATHQILGGQLGLNQDTYINLRSSAISEPLAPVIHTYVISQDLGGIPMQLLGIDPFAEGSFRDYLGSMSAEPRLTTPAWRPFLTRPGTILVSDRLAAKYAVENGQNINLEISGRIVSVQIIGLLHASDELSQRALDGIILADISTVQEITGREGYIDSIDVILPEGKEGDILAKEIEAQLSGTAKLQPVSARSGAVEQMTAAFRLNLTALSLLALVVGMFLIYNTMTFSVVQRRALFGTLRSLGATRRQIFSLVIWEALTFSLVGSGLGLVLGVWMGHGTVRMISQTINDLFFAVNVQSGAIPVESLAKGIILGVAATLLSTAPPAWEAASVSPRAALSRSDVEGKASKAITLAFRIGLMLILAGCLLLVLPSRSLVLSFISTLAVVVGFAMLVPRFTGILTRNITPLLERLLGVLGRIAPRDVESSLSRTSIAVMALMVAVSVSVGVSLMVNSFRYTVTTWLDETLLGDIYISVPAISTSTPSESLVPEVQVLAKNWPGVERADVLRSIEVSSTGGEVKVAATDNFSIVEERNFKAADLAKEDIWPSMLSGSVIVSEPFAERMRIPLHGGKVILVTPEGEREFPVVGVFYDYASVAGTVVMALPVYQELWKDMEITAIQLRLKPETEVDDVVGDLQTALTAYQGVRVQANRILKQEALKIFDRTFLITNALQLIATVVAFIGILSALLSLELEKQHQLGILRSVGMTVGQVRALIISGTGLMGTIAGLLALPAGYILSIILIFIINKRSFGWTLQMHVDPFSFLEALGISVLAAVLAGIYPSIRIGGISPSEALRSE